MSHCRELFRHSCAGISPLTISRHRPCILTESASNRRVRKYSHARRACRNRSSKAIPEATAARITVSNNASFIRCEKFSSMESIYRSQAEEHVEKDESPQHSRRHEIHLKYRSICRSGLEERGGPKSQ